jgi:LacI family transcriptional regulator
MGLVRRKIAYFSCRQLGGERSERRLSGLLRYVAEQQGDLSVADFRVLDETLPPSPPWAGRVEGAIVDWENEPGILEWLLQGGVPFVSASGDLYNLPVISIFSDVQSAARLAAEHFVDLGFREFAFVGPQASDASRKWRQALAEELERRGHSLDAYESPVTFYATFEELLHPAVADPKIAELLSRRRGRLAVMTLNDEYGVSICRIAASLGMAVPDDVAVLGVGDTTVSKIAVPPLSSIRADLDESGYQAGRLVHRLMDGKEVAKLHWPIPVLGLVARESTVGRQATAQTDVDRALGFIRDHACEGISARDVAAKLHLALRTFELQFQAVVGHTAAEEIRRVRMEGAKTLLANTNMSITQIAGEVGCHDASYFASFFRRHAGVKPSEYRKLATSRQIAK